MHPRSKGRKKPARPEVVYDPVARAEYLTGFQKRKKQRAEHVKEVAESRAREDKLRGRKELREKRVRDMEARIEAYNDMLAQSYVENGESDAIAKSGPHSDATAEGSDQSGDEQETFETAYVEQGTYSTVTVEGISVSKFGLDSQTADTDIADIGQGKKTVIQPAGEAPKKVKVLKGRRSRQSRPRAASASRKGRAAKSPKDSRDRVKSGGRKSHPSKRK